MQDTKLACSNTQRAKTEIYKPRVINVGAIALLITATKLYKHRHRRGKNICFRVVLQGFDFLAMLKIKEVKNE